MTRAAGAVLLGVGLVLAALLFDLASLHLPGVALALLGAVSAVWVGLAAQGAGIERVPGPATIEEEEPYPLRLHVRPGLLPAPAGELHHPLLSAPVPLSDARRRLRVDVRFARRGRRTIEPGSLVVHDPLWLAARELAAGGGVAEVIVLPRVEPVLAPEGGGGGSGAGPEGEGTRPAWRARMDGSASELELDGLRPYRRGTPASRIHWPAVARSGEMLERRLSADADSAPLVVLDAHRPPGEEALDMAVRAAASLCLHLARRGGVAVLLPDDRRPVSLGADLAGWPAVHARLALVEAARARPALSRARRAGAVIWVSARIDPPRDLARVAGAGAWMVSPAGGQASGGGFTVAGCLGRRVGRSASRDAGRAA